MYSVVIYHSPGQLGTFIQELNVLLFSFSEDGNPLVVFGDFNIHLEKPYTAASTFKVSFDMKCLTITGTL